MDKGVLWTHLPGQQMSSCILEKLSLIHIPGSIIILLKGQLGQLGLNTRTTEEGDLSAEWVSPFPRMSAVFWTDTPGRAQERGLCQPCGKELPCTPRCQCTAGGQSLSYHQKCIIREEHPDVTGTREHQGDLKQSPAPC